MKFRGMIAGLMVLFSGLACANPMYRGGPAVGEAPAAELKKGVEALLAFVSSEPRPEAAAVAAFLDKEIAPYFDFKRMARSVAGPLARRMTKQQRAALTADLRRHFLVKLAARLGSYQGQGVRFLRPVPGRGGRTVTAGVAILNPGTYPARIDFRLYRTPEGWRVYDVAANGQSAVVHFRRALRGSLMRHMRAQRVPGRGPATGPGMAPRPAPAPLTR